MYNCTFFFTFIKMSEKEFWTNYFQSLRMYREGRVSTISTQKADDMFMKVASEQEKDQTGTAALLSSEFSLKPETSFGLERKFARQEYSLNCCRTNNNKTKTERC